VRLKLDVANFDDQAFAGVIQQCERDGIVFTTMNNLGDHDTNHRRHYELNRTCSWDIPERGVFYSYEDYVERRIRRDYSPQQRWLRSTATRGLGWQPRPTTPTRATSSAR
jgi:hypothetical protein